MTEERPLRTRAVWRVLVLAVFAGAGYFFVASGVTSAGSDLRPTGGDPATVLRDDTVRLEARQQVLADLNAEVDELSATSDDAAVAENVERYQALEPRSGLTEVTGAGMRVVLDDAPRDQEVIGLDVNALVVHQQDIQAYVNALWAGGAEAITIQGQRIVGTSAIKCVGSTVVLDGVPYVPPYVIEAVGDPRRLQQAIDDSPAAKLYAEYSERYRLGLEITPAENVTAPAYTGTVSLRHAEVADPA